MAISRHMGIIGLTVGMLLVRIVLAWSGYFPFTWDFGRDMLWVRQLTIEHKPMLVGAWGSLDGTFFGPAYFYLLTIPMWLSNGDPRAAVIMVSLIITALIPLGYWLGNRWFNVRVGWWWALLFALMPIYTQLSLYSFPQQLIPFVFMGLIAALWELWQKPRNSMWFVAGFLASLIFHFEPVDAPIGYLTLCIWMGLMIKKKRYQPTPLSLGALILGLGIPLVPNLIYDVRHSCGQARALWGLVTGEDTSLGGGLPLWQRLLDRPMNIGTITARSITSIAEPWLGLIIISIIGGLFVIQKKAKTPFLGLLGILSSTTFIYFVIFPRLLKDYYLYFVPIIITLAVGVEISRIKINRRSLLLISTGIIGILLVGQWQTIRALTGATDATTYKYQQQTITQIYQQANGQSFKAFVYTPVIYDYPYQYLFWWWGKRTFGYLPIEYAYKPNQPEYVYKKSVFDKNIPTREISGGKVAPTFLIFEPGDHVGYSRAYWRSLYPSSITTEMIFPGGLQLLQVQ